MPRKHCGGAGHWRQDCRNDSTCERGLSKDNRHPHSKESVDAVLSIVLNDVSNGNAFHLQKFWVVGTWPSHNTTLMCCWHHSAQCHNHS